MSDLYDLFGENNKIASIRKNVPSSDCYSADIYSEKAASELTGVLNGNTHLRNLSINVGPNVNDARNLASAISNSKLVRLSLEWHYFYREKDRHNARCLLDAVRLSPTIQHLHVTTVADEGIDEIVRCMPHLQSLHLKGEFVAGDVGLLCEGLERTSTLTTLHVSDTSIGSLDCIRQLSQALANNSSLISLRLEYCDMDDNCVKAFLQHWHHDSRIRVLAFAHTKIKAEGAMLLIQAASSHPALESLSINNNRRIGYDGLVNIAMELPNIVLKSLNVASCLASCYGRNNLNCREAAVVMVSLIAQGVKANTNLVEIDVSGNGFDAHTGQVVNNALVFYMLRNKYNLLMVSDVQLPASVWCHCFAKNGRNASFIFHFLREQPMLWHVSHKNKKQRIR